MHKYHKYVTTHSLVYFKASLWPNFCLAWRNFLAALRFTFTDDKLTQGLFGWKVFISPHPHLESIWTEYKILGWYPRWWGDGVFFSPQWLLLSITGLCSLWLQVYSNSYILSYTDTHFFPSTVSSFFFSKPRHQGLYVACVFTFLGFIEILGYGGSFPQWDSVISSMFLLLHSAHMTMLDVCSVSGLPFLLLFLPCFFLHPFFLCLFFFFFCLFPWYAFSVVLGTDPSLCILGTFTASMLHCQAWCGLF